jgi:hypothetical protein
MLHFAPLAPQFWGELELQSPPELGDLGGKSALDTNQRTCVYTVAAEGRGGEVLLPSPFRGRVGRGVFFGKTLTQTQQAPTGKQELKNGCIKRLLLVR